MPEKGNTRHGVKKQGQLQMLPTARWLEPQSRGPIGYTVRYWVLSWARTIHFQLNK